MENNLVGFDMCKGNPGALAFMCEAYGPDKPFKDIVKAENAFRRMRRENIQGSKLYMLWNDCCDRDTDKALEIMLFRDIDEIIEHINYEGGRGIPFEEVTERGALNE